MNRNNNYSGDFEPGVEDVPLRQRFVLLLRGRGGRRLSGKIIIIIPVIMIMIINVEPAHRHDAEPVRRRVHPLGALLLRVLDDRERGLKHGAGGAGRGHGGRDPDRSKLPDGDNEPALDLPLDRPLPRCLFPSLYYIYIYI